MIKNVAGFVGLMVLGSAVYCVSYIAGEALGKGICAAVYKVSDLIAEKKREKA